MIRHSSFILSFHAALQGGGSVTLPASSSPCIVVTYVEPRGEGRAEWEGGSCDLSGGSVFLQVGGLCFGIGAGLRCLAEPYSQLTLTLTSISTSTSILIQPKTCARLACRRRESASRWSASQAVGFSCFARPRSSSSSSSSRSSGSSSSSLNDVRSTVRIHGAARG